MAPKRPKGRPERISKLLSFGNSALGNRLKDLEIWQQWDAVVGPMIAKRAQPLRLVNGVLTIVVSNGPWMQQLSFMKRELAERLNERLGETRIQEIILKTGRVAASAQPEAEARSYRKSLSPEQIADINRRAEELPDPELQQAFSQLMQAHLSRTT